MRIRVFEKIIEFDEKNKGINFFLEECCEFPTEDWFKVVSEQMRNAGKTTKHAEEMTVPELKDTLKFGMLNIIDFVGSQNNLDVEEEKNCVRMAF